MLPLQAKPISLEQFLGRPGDDAVRIRQFHDKWDKIDRALTRH